MAPSCPFRREQSTYGPKPSPHLGSIGRKLYSLSQRERVRVRGFSQSLEDPSAPLCGRREGGALSCAPSADAVAGNGRPLSWAPSAHAVAGGVATFTPVLSQGEGHTAAKNSSTMRLNSAGFSKYTECPAPATSAKRACG